MSRRHSRPNTWASLIWELLSHPRFLFDAIIVFVVICFVLSLCFPGLFARYQKQDNNELSVNLAQEDNHSEISKEPIIAILAREMEIRYWTPWKENDNSTKFSDEAKPYNDMAVYKDHIFFKCPKNVNFQFHDVSEVRGQIYMDYLSVWDDNLIIDIAKYKDWKNRSTLEYNVTIPVEKQDYCPTLYRQFSYTNCYPMGDKPTQVGLRIPYHSRIVEVSLDFNLLSVDKRPGKVTCRLEIKCKDGGFFSKPCKIKEVFVVCSIPLNHLYLQQKRFSPLYCFLQVAFASPFLPSQLA